MLLLFSCSIVSLWPHGLWHTRPPCPSPSPRVCPSSCPLSWWCHPTISSSVTPFSCFQSFPPSGSFPVSWFFVSGGQSIGVSASASVLPMCIQGWFPLGLTGFVSLQAKGLSRVFSKKQWSYTTAYIWNLERWYWWTYLQSSNGETDIKNRLMDTADGGRRGWEV